MAFLDIQSRVDAVAASIVIVSIVGLLLYHFGNSIDWGIAIMIAWGAMSAFGLYLGLRLIFAIIHRLER